MARLHYIIIAILLRRNYLRKKRNAKYLQKNRLYLTREALVETKKSSWYQLYHYGNDTSFAATTSLFRAGFERLLISFKRHFIINYGI